MIRRKEFAYNGFVSSETSLRANSIDKKRSDSCSAYTGPNPRSTSATLQLLRRIRLKAQPRELTQAEKPGFKNLAETVLSIQQVNPFKQESKTLDQTTDNSPSRSKNHIKITTIRKKDLAKEVQLKSTTTAHLLTQAYKTEPANMFRLMKEKKSSSMAKEFKPASDPEPGATCGGRRETGSFDFRRLDAKPAASSSVSRKHGCPLHTEFSKCLSSNQPSPELPKYSPLSQTQKKTGQAQPAELGVHQELQGLRAPSGVGRLLLGSLLLCKPR